MTGQAVNTENSRRKGSARIQAATPCRDLKPVGRRGAGGGTATSGRDGVTVATTQLPVPVPVPMASALVCTDFTAAAGSAPDLVTFSISLS